MVFNVMFTCGRFYSVLLSLYGCHTSQIERIPEIFEAIFQHLHVRNERKFFPRTPLVNCYFPVMGGEIIAFGNCRQRTNLPRQPISGNSTSSFPDSLVSRWNFADRLTYPDFPEKAASPGLFDCFIILEKKLDKRSLTQRQKSVDNGACVAAVRTAENERYAVLRCTIEHVNHTLFSFEVEPRDSSLLQVIETCARARVPTLHLTYVARSHAGPPYQNCTLYTYTQVFFDVFFYWNGTLRS